MRTSEIMKKVWIDLENSPHVPFFYPIIEKLKSRSIKVVLTAKDCYQVCGLLNMYGMSSHIAGSHYGKNKILKIAGTFMRSASLLRFAAQQNPDLALSHGSRSQLITASILRIPAIWIADYEYSQKIPFIRPKEFIIPEVMNADKCWMHDSTVKSYPGIKEDVYVPFFKPDSRILRELCIDHSHVIVTIRPPASEAHYHNPESDELFVRVIQHLSGKPQVQMIILPRTDSNAKWIQHEWSELIDRRKIIIPPKVVNGLNLIWYSDLVISGGGTMNREAAALHVPVYSIFKGKIGAVDRYLSENGRLILIESVEEISSKIALQKRVLPAHPESPDSRSLQRIEELIMNELM